MNSSLALDVVGAASELRPPYWLEIEVTGFQAEYPSAGAAPVIRVHLLARLGDQRRRTTLGSYAADASRAASADRTLRARPPRVPGS